MALNVSWSDTDTTWCCQNTRTVWKKNTKHTKSRIFGRRFSPALKALMHLQPPKLALPTSRHWRSLLALRRKKIWFVMAIFDKIWHNLSCFMANQMWPLVYKLKHNLTTLRSASKALRLKSCFLQSFGTVQSGLTKHGCVWRMPPEVNQILLHVVLIKQPALLG